MLSAKPVSPTAVRRSMSTAFMVSSRVPDRGVTTIRLALVRLDLDAPEFGYHMRRAPDIDPHVALGIAVAGTIDGHRLYSKTIEARYNM